MRRGKKRKGIEAQRGKLPTPSQGIDEHIGDEEQNGEHKKRNRERIRIPANPDHLVASFDPHGSYSRPVLKHLHIQGVIYIYIYIYIYKIQRNWN